MKIGFDAKRAAQNRTGLGNYSRFVLNILNCYRPDNNYCLYIPNEKKTQCFKEIDRPESFRVLAPKGFLQRIFRSFWRVWGISGDLRRERLDIFHGLSNELPLTIKKAGCRSVVTIHDLIFLHYPQYYKPIDRWIYSYKFRKACENADRVIAVSEFTKQEIMRYFHTPEGKISVVYQGCAAQFREKASDEKKAEVRERYGLPARYILYVGTIEERKNLLLLVKALQHLPEDVKVVAFGRKTKYLQTIIDNRESIIDNRQSITDNRKPIIENRLILVHKSDFRDLPAVYQQAEIFVYPSRIEGFGIPMLEALCSGVPAIGCTGSCLEEAGGPDSVYVDPDDEKALAEEILSILNDKEKRERMISKGYEYAERFKEENLCRELWKVYEETLFLQRTTQRESTSSFL